MIVRSIRSSSDEPNGALQPFPRKAGEDNVAWLERVVKERCKGAGNARTLIVLLGGTDPLSFRLRVAQSHVRDDFSPSSWSHALFVAWPSGETREISLAPRGGFGPAGFASATNGIQEGVVSDYQDAETFPNIAALALPVSSREVGAAIDGLQGQRPVIDFPEIILHWLAYVWGAGPLVNPLSDGFGIPAAALLETALGSVGFDLTPGLESRSSCPEAIWQAAKWWHDYYERTHRKPVQGAYAQPHRLIPGEARDTGPQPPEASGRKRKTSTKRAPKGSRKGARTTKRRGR